MSYYFKNGVKLLRKSAKMNEQDTYCAWENVPVEYIKFFVENGQEKKRFGNALEVDVMIIFKRMDLTERIISATV
jgi:hypothetical protein